MSDDFATSSEAVFDDSVVKSTDEFATSSEAVFGDSDKFAQYDKKEALFKSAVGGATEFGGVVPGAIAGAILTAPIPIPGARVVGALAGGIGAWYAGSKAREELADRGYAVENVEDLPKRLRPYGYAGESIGGSLGFGGSVGLLGKLGYQTTGKTPVGRYLNSIFKTSATPKSVGIEVSTGVSAALGAGFAERHKPGETGIRVTAEIGAGLTNPSQLLSAFVNKGIDIGKKALNAISKNSQESTAGKVLRETLENYGEDPQLITRLLTKEGIDVGKQTLAQKTGSLTLVAMEKSLSQYSKTFSVESATLADESLKTLSVMYESLFRLGDPEALKAAAQIKHQHIKMLLVGRVQAAEHKAYKAVSKITQDTPSARAEISSQAKKALGDALTEARKAETELWESIDKNTPSGIDSLMSRYKNIKADMLPEIRSEKLPLVVSNFIKRVTGKDANGVIVGTNAGEMMQLRSELLENARELSKAGKYNQSRIYNELADSVLNDLDGAFNGVAGDAYDTARVFSRELNEVFSNTFVGKALSTGRYGDNVAPEILLRKALAGGKEASDLQLQELEEATRFMVTRGLSNDDAVVAMLQAQDRIIRLAAADMIDPETGKIGIKQISKFIRDNEALLSRFPEIKDDLVDAVKSESFRKNIQASVKNSTRIIESQTILSKLANGDPVEMAHRALLSFNQEKELKNLISIAKKGGTEAIHGLKTSVFDAGIRKSTTNGHLQLDKLKNILYNPSTPGRKAPIEILKDNDIFTKNEIKNIDSMFEVFDKIMVAKNTNTVVELPNNYDSIFDFGQRIIGSSVAVKIGKLLGTETPSLIHAAAGSTMSRSIFNKIPTTKVRDVLIQSMTDPELMKRLLRKTENNQQVVEKARQIHAYLVSSGMYNTEKAVNPDEPR